jgi:sporulation protein YlmC with PRC-barrel domain
MVPLSRINQFTTNQRQPITKKKESIEYSYVVVIGAWVLVQPPPL